MGEGFEPREFVRTLTHRPGVYRMIGADDEVLYVGKARDLRRRVGSYFSRRATDGKTQAMLQGVQRVEVTVTTTELEALLLEYNLIKEHKPRFNVLLRDDKSYPYIHLSTQQEFPRIELHRGSRQGPGRFFGPYPHAGAAREVIQQVQKLFRLRPCEDSFFANRSRPCLQYQIHRCSAPCTGLIDAAEYRRDVDNAVRLIEGRDEEILADLVGRMERSSAALEYEDAARYRDLIADIRKVQETQTMESGSDTDLDAIAFAREHGQGCVAVLMIRGGRVLGSRCFFPRQPPQAGPPEVLGAFLLQHYLAQPPPAEILLGEPIADAALISQALTHQAGHPVALRSRVRTQRRRWLEIALVNAREAAIARAHAASTLVTQFGELGIALGLPQPPGRIECFDVSHTQGGETVASCVVFRDTGPVKSDYRRFNIRDIEPGDDYSALAQAVQRRYARAVASGGSLPDVVVVDGGPAQLKRVHGTLAGIGLGALWVIAVAKGEGRRPGREQLFIGATAAPLELEGSSAAFQLIRQLRDEAHRFAISGHRARRSRARLGSALEGIPGLGPRRRRSLLQHFGGLQGISRAGAEDLARAPGISRGLAERIYRHFHHQGPDPQ